MLRSVTTARESGLQHTGKQLTEFVGIRGAARTRPVLAPSFWRSVPNLEGAWDALFELLGHGFGHRCIISRPLDAELLASQLDIIECEARGRLGDGAELDEAKLACKNEGREGGGAVGCAERRELDDACSMAMAHTGSFDIQHAWRVWL
eukprot:2427316-Pleurochrysis_carterae.AAC.1